MGFVLEMRNDAEWPEIIFEILHAIALSWAIDQVIRIV